MEFCYRVVASFFAFLTCFVLNRCRCFVEDEDGFGVAGREMVER